MIMAPVWGPTTRTARVGNAIPARGMMSTTTRPAAGALFGSIEENKYGIFYFSGFSCPTLNPWEYMGVQLPYIREQTAKTTVLAVLNDFN